MLGQNNLPMPRGASWSDGGGTGMTVANLELEHLLGAEFTVKDTQHNTGVDVVLRFLKNASGAALTAANKLYMFDTGAKDYGREVSGLNTTKGGACIPMDDAYATGYSIPNGDYFWGVVRGPCNITTEAGTVVHEAGMEVVGDNLGCLYEAGATAGEFLIGTVDQGGDAEDTAVLVWVDLWLGGWKGS